MNEDILTTGMRLSKFIRDEKANLKGIEGLIEDSPTRPTEFRISSSRQGVLLNLTKIEEELLLTMVKTFSEKRLAQLAKEFEAL